MNKNVFGRKLKRDRNERAALFKGLLSSLVLYEKIETTEQKAKAIKGQADKLITTAKKGGPNVHSRLYRFLTPSATQKLVVEITPRFSNRSGGYTRLVRLGRRLSDNASMMLMEWVERPEIREQPSADKAKTKNKDKNNKQEELKAEAQVKKSEEKKAKTKAAAKPKAEAKKKGAKKK